MKIVRIGAIWCPGCLVMRNVWKKLSENYTLDIIEYDYDMDEDNIKKYDIGDKLPVTIFFDTNNNELSRCIGEKTYDELESIIKDYINKGV